MKYYLYRINEDGDADIYACFDSLSAAKLSAKLLMIEEICFILVGDLSKMYFYEKDSWEYDILTERGKMEFLEFYPDPKEYQFDE